jgi:FKBP-type peptidyl-prolyl cis-trans isomerase 2
VGERVTVRIEPAEAYGERDESRIVEVPYAPSQEDVAVGDIVTLNTGEQAEVLEVRSETVVLDANHPLAGQALTFEIEVVAITRG